VMCPPPSLLVPPSPSACVKCSRQCFVDSCAEPLDARPYVTYIGVGQSLWFARSELYTVYTSLTATRVCLDRFSRACYLASDVIHAGFGLQISGLILALISEVVLSKILRSVAIGVKFGAMGACNWPTSDLFIDLSGP